MTIRYFATNRALDGLARMDSGKDGRITRRKLSSGGYYFLDMASYTQHYLAEVDNTAPVSAVVDNSSKTVFADFLGKEEVERVVVCVHGFSQSLQDGLDWFSVMTDTLRHTPKTGHRLVVDPDQLGKLKTGEKAVAVIGFSWPSNGSVLDYPADQKDALASANAFGNLLVRIALYGKPITLICHSMGNYMAANALSALVDNVHRPSVLTEAKISAIQGLSGDAASILATVDAKLERGQPKSKRLVSDFIMVAPDIDRRHVTKNFEGGREVYVGPFYSGLEHLVGAAHNVFSRYDGALQISNMEKLPRKGWQSLRAGLDWVAGGVTDAFDEDADKKWEKRIGQGPHPTSAPKTMVSLNAAEIAQRPIGHGDHVDSPAITARFANILGL